ncbi:hypothetical protein [Mangrovactinospora gilvigrisea]|uniref:hypothetical protein n=1 Tax=Mangrovactinospora gilvigrisea TaxID=1428644 RepID=UPI001114E459|nr:hypothetical protein [Mangrovactinospora gilvigrisea]
MPDQVGQELLRLRAAAREKGPDANEAKSMLSHYILALVEAGWAKSAIATPMEVTRQEVHRLSLQAAKLPAPRSLPEVPPLPAKEPAASKKLRDTPQISPSEAKRLRELAPLATKVRGVTPEDDPSRAAAVEYGQLLADLWKRGVSRKELQRITGQAPATIRARLARHGHINRGATEQPYKGKQAEFAKKREYCKAGHEFTPENTYEYHRPDGRIARSCRTCHARRQREMVESRKELTGAVCPKGHPLTDDNTVAYNRKDGTEVKLCRICLEARQEHSSSAQRKDTCKRGHAFTPENTYEHQRPDGKVVRTCRKCKMIRQREYEERHGITSHR